MSTRKIHYLVSEFLIPFKMCNVYSELNSYLCIRSTSTLSGHITIKLNL